MYVNIVLAVVGIIGGLTLLRNSAEPDKPRLSVPSTIVGSAAIFGLVFGSATAQTDGWGSAVTLTPLIAGVLLAGFVVLQKVVRHLLIPLRVCADRNRGAAYLTLFLANAAVFALFLFLTYYTLVAVNFRGTVFTVQYLLPLMSDGASIILNGTTSATKGIPGAGVYSASKAAVRSLARTWAAELKDRGIRVNVISPGSIDTALFSSVTPEFREQITSAIPLGRLGTSEEIAAAALFLASPDASFITGANLVVDGGFSHI